MSQPLSRLLFDRVLAEEDGLFSVASAVADLADRITVKDDLWWCGKHRTTAAVPVGRTRCSAVTDDGPDDHKRDQFGCGLHLLVNIGLADPT